MEDHLKFVFLASRICRQSLGDNSTKLPAIWNAVGVCMEKIIDQEITYDKAFHYHCLKNCLRQLLEYNHVKDAFLYVDVSCDLILHKAGLTTYQTQMSAPYQNLWEPFRKSLERNCFDDEEESVSYVKGLLEKGRPVIVAVDSFFLPYRNTYQKYHGSHAIILTDYRDNHYQLIDWYEPHFYKGFLEEELLRKARGSKNQWDNNPFSGQEIKRATYLLHMFTKEYDSEQVFLYGVMQIYQAFYKKRVSYTNGNIFYGLDAFIELAKIVPDLLADSPAGKEKCRKLHNDIFILYIARKLQAFYFQQYLMTNRKGDGEKIEIGNTEKINLLTYLQLLLSDYEKVLFLIMKHSVKWSKDNVTNLEIGFDSIRRKEESYGKSLMELYECRKGDCNEISI